jgi:hypothetical protein
MADNKKSILKEAITDYKQIQEAADKAAKEKLANEFPDKFRNLVKEELDNNNKKSAKESYKKLDESDNKNTESMKKDEKETKKVNEEREKSFMADVESDTPNKEKESDGDGVAFKEKSSKESVANHKEVKGGAKEKSISVEKESEGGVEKVNEEFDVSDLDLPDAEAAIDDAGAEDEIVTMDEIEKEISEMEKLQKSQLDTEEDSDPYAHIVGMKDQLQEMLDSIQQMQEMHQGKFDLEKMHKGEYDENLIDEKKEEMDEMHQGKFDLEKMHKGEYDEKLIDEDEVISDEDIKAAMGDEELDEDLSHVITHSNAKHAGAHNHTNYGKEERLRYALRGESLKKKVADLLEQNKKLTKKINESKKYKETVTELVENYKNALDKYRTQLKEMAVYNTNLAHVNNLLVNEELALTQEEKVKIIKEFKTVDSISDSQKKYKEVLAEMKEGKKTISEGATIEGKLNESVGESSKKKLGEIEEKTAYKNDKGIGRMKQLIESMEKKDKKING